MRRAVYLIGGPGTGKSTALRHILKGVRLDEPGPVDPKFPLLTGQSFRDSSGVYLGKRGGKFPGTDRLSMAVSPQAVDWALSNRVPEIVIGEGARLGNAKFLAALSSSTDLIVGHLITDEHVVAGRFRKRGSEQSDSWVKGRRTAAENTARDLEGAGIKVVTIHTDEDRPGAVADRFRPHLGLAPHTANVPAGR